MVGGSFLNSTIRLSNSDLFTDCTDSLYNDLTITHGVFFMLHMEVPYESMLSVLCGLDINWFLVLLGSLF